MSHILALGGHFGRTGKNCICCEVDSRDLFKKNPSKKRTLKRLYEMAHMVGPGVTFPFTCPGCRKTFKSSDELDNEVAPTNQIEYEIAHASTSWHRRPLLDIEPSMVVLCCLHLVLSLTKLLFKKRILWMVHTDDQAFRLNSLLQSFGICIPKQGKVGDTLAQDQSERVRFTGPDCFALMRNFDVVVAEVVKGAPNLVGLQEWARET